jgi:hypothetical protein
LEDPEGAELGHHLVWTKWRSIPYATMKVEDVDEVRGGIRRIVIRLIVRKACRIAWRFPMAGRSAVRRRRKVAVRGLV